MIYSAYAKENIPAEKVEKSKKTRIPLQDGYSWWSQGFKKKKGEG